MCRVLCTLACGDLLSKHRAVAWALERLPEPWYSTVERSQTWCVDDTLNPTIVPEVMQFVCWVASDGESVVCQSRVLNPSLEPTGDVARFAGGIV